jgi:hypothetical protein|tara:strand:+ start:2630 stop:2764 length:135 start_codon:yes stop_codon:yes gene_type:complete
MEIITKVEETSTEDYYKLTIDGVEVGTYERSQLRQIIGSIDNVI